MARHLRILVLAAATSETEVEAALMRMLEERHALDVEVLKGLIGQGREPISPPALEVPAIDLDPYDALLSAGGLS